MPPPSGGCAWCGAMPAEPYEIEPAITDKEPGTGRPIVKRAARSFLACTTHREHFDADKARRAAEKAADRQRKADAKAGRP
jgi:hypothetical protein